METLLNAALSNAAVVALLAPIVLAIDRRLGRPAVANRLWLLLLIKLVTPPIFDVPIPRLGPSMVAMTPDPPPPLPPLTRMTEKGLDADPTVRPVDPTMRTAPPAGRPKAPIAVAARPWREVVEDARAFIPALWLTIAAAWLVQAGWQIRRASRRLRLASEPATEEVQARARALADRMGIRRCPGVWTVRGAVSPMLWSFGRPRLLMPADLWDGLDDSRRDTLLAHELAHYRRRDHWVRPLELVVLALYWWLPIAWWARRALRASEERCCDAWVVWALPDAWRRYAVALLDTLDFLASARPPASHALAASGLGRFDDLKARLALIVSGTTRRRLSRPGSAAVLGLAVLLLPFATGLGRVPRYSIRDVGPIFPTAMNNHAQVVGSGPVKVGSARSIYYWDDGVFTDVTPGLSGNVYAIDDSGRMVGTYFKTSINYRPNMRVFRTGPGRPIDPIADDLGNMGNGLCTAVGIDDLGRVAGDGGAQTDGNVHIFRTSGDAPIDPRRDDLSGGVGGRAMRMNRRGQILAVMFQLVIQDRPERKATRFYHYVVTRPDRPIDLTTDVIYVQGEDSSLQVKPVALNGRGQVAGTFVSEIPEGPGAKKRWHAFRSRPGRPIDPAIDDLGVIGEEVWPPSNSQGFGCLISAMNDVGQIVGTTTRDGASFTFLLDGRTVYALPDLVPPDSGWRFHQVVAINNRGQILGFGQGPGDDQRSFLLTPVSEVGRSLSLMMLGVVATGAGLSVRRRA